MTIDELKSQRDQVEADFNKQNQQSTSLQVELNRLQGDWRTLNHLIEVEEAAAAEPVKVPVEEVTPSE